MKAMAFAVLSALLFAAPLAAQDTAAARTDGKTFGKDMAPAAQEAATTEPDASRIPNFTSSPAQSAYFDNPGQMPGDAAGAASSSDGYNAVRSSMDNRASFDPAFIKDATSRSRKIAADPLQYASGMGASGSQSRCVPLPPGIASPGRYQATCNTGYKLETITSSCTIPLVAAVTTVSDYLYFCSNSGAGGGSGGEPDCSLLQGTTCQRTASHPGKCLQWSLDGGGARYCPEPGDPIDEYTCSAAVAGLTPVSVSNRQVAHTSRDESVCGSLAADTSCNTPAETCTDSDPVTRTINGINVTAPCWAWSRSYQCTRAAPAQDCSSLETAPGCTFVHEDCITDEQPCRTFERVYDCPVPSELSSPQQFICDGNVYCIDGKCETIEREANDEFKDAATALNAMDQAKNEFDPNNLTLFKGERNTCSSQVFGIINCCKGKGFPLIPGMSILVALACSAQEILLHQRDVQGLCAYVGSYCADSFLGICLTKKKVYCCFQSKLSRILQEQGRAQLPKPWNKPKSEQCAGFTIDEFARLDLSKMDFSEVYAEFTGAAKLPDELNTASQLQQKIEAYYAAHRP